MDAGKIGSSGSTESSEKIAERVSSSVYGSSKDLILTAENVSRQYFRDSKGSNYFYAVKDVSLELASGTISVITGRSGSGKSTLMNMMCGLLEPMEGKVFLTDSARQAGAMEQIDAARQTEPARQIGTAVQFEHAEQISSARETEPARQIGAATRSDPATLIDLFALSDEERSKLRNHRFGIIPQGQTGLHSLTLIENVLLPLTMYGGLSLSQIMSSEKDCHDATGKDEEENKFLLNNKSAIGNKSALGNKMLLERGRTLLERVGLVHLMNVYPNELSGGEMRRLAIARALILDPDVIFADEPTGDLDDENTKIVLNLIRELANEGKAIMLVTHEKEAEAYGDRIYRMNEGGLVEISAKI